MRNLMKLMVLQAVVLLSVNLEAEQVVRAALDIGSGATKLRVAVVETDTNRIEKILTDTQFAIDYQEDLEKSANFSFSEEVMLKGLDSLKKSQKIASDLGAQKVVAIATAAFRNANNAQIFIDRINKETGVEVYVIDQDLEGKLAFEAALSALGANEAHALVWDIGGGSLQLTAKKGEDHYMIYRGHDASVPFKNWIVQVLQGKNIEGYTSPNPMKHIEVNTAERHARFLAQKVDQAFQDHIAKRETQVLGVGSIFGIRMQDLMGKEVFTKAELREKVTALALKEDDEVGGGPFANVAISNPILILGFMEQLGIDQVTIVDVNNSDGAMIYPLFWKDTPTQVAETYSCPSNYCCY